MATNSTTLELILTARDEATQKLAVASRSLENMQATLKKVGAVSATVFAGVSAVALSTVKAFSEAEAQTAITNKSIENSFASLTKTMEVHVGVSKKNQEKIKENSKEVTELKSRMGDYSDALRVATAKVADMSVKMKDNKADSASSVVAYDLAKKKVIELQEAIAKTSSKIVELGGSSSDLGNTYNTVVIGQFEKLRKEMGGVNDVLGELKKRADAAGAAAVKLGFDDETAANSFAKLFAVTKSVTQTQKELALAMDLARFKGISLEEATQKLVMVHSGATKELKALGIEVKDGATAMQNLDSITKQVTGSSEAYLKTTAGATEVLKVNMDNLKETIGQALAPALTSLVATITPVVSKIADWILQHPELTKWIVIITGAIAGMVAILSALGIVIATVTAVSSPWLLIIGAIILAIGALIAITVLLVKKWDTIKAYFKDLWEDIKETFRAAIDSITGYFGNLLNVVENVINKMRQVATSVGNTVMAPINFASNLVTGKRALGGNVSGGSSYLVGENGPEIFSPGTTGFITPNNARGGSGATFNININGAVFSRDAAEMLGNEIVNRFKLTSRIGL